MTQPEDLPQRCKLPHAIPPGVRQGVRHFITVNCREREVDPLCRGDVATQLLNSARYYEEIGHWYLWLMVVMPDHLHLIATFDLERGLQAIMKGWKGYQKRNLSIEWQTGFFEHRIRNDDEFVEKMHYVRMNPVRKGLVVSPDKWPHVLSRTDLDEEAGAIINRAKPPAEPTCLTARQGRLALPAREEDDD
jgi:putative transposase